MLSGYHAAPALLWTWCLRTSASCRRLSRTPSWLRAPSGSGSATGGANRAVTQSVSHSDRQLFHHSVIKSDSQSVRSDMLWQFYSLLTVSGLFPNVMGFVLQRCQGSCNSLLHHQVAEQYLSWAGPQCFHDSRGSMETPYHCVNALCKSCHSFHKGSFTTTIPIFLVIITYWQWPTRGIDLIWSESGSLRSIPDNTLHYHHVNCFGLLAPRLLSDLNWRIFSVGKKKPHLQSVSKDLSLLVTVCG